MKPRILVLGAGFGGLELATTVSEELADEVDVAVLDRRGAFVFGYSKLDVMFGRTQPDAVQLDYRRFAKPGVRLMRETVLAIDPVAKEVTTDAGVHEADHLVIALGADYDYDATPGLAGATEFYSVRGAERLAELLPQFSGGHAVVGVCGAPFKCPPAPSEAAFLLHEHLVRRGIRDRSRVSLVMPFRTPIPPSPDSSRAILAACAERGIEFISGRRVASERHDGIGSCFIEWGDGLAGRVNVDFFSGEEPSGTFDAPTEELAADKERFGATRRQRWFGIEQ